VNGEGLPIRQTNENTTDGARQMKIERRFTTSGQSAYAGIEFRLATSEIRNPDGSVVFKARDVEVPASWSQVACDILAQKYFRRAGVPAALKRIEEQDVPTWLWRSTGDEEKLADFPEKERRTGETSAKQVFNLSIGHRFQRSGMFGPNQRKPNGMSFSLTRAQPGDFSLNRSEDEFFQAGPTLGSNGLNLAEHRVGNFDGRSHAGMLTQKHIYVKDR